MVSYTIGICSLDVPKVRRLERVLSALGCNIAESDKPECALTMPNLTGDRVRDVINIFREFDFWEVTVWRYDIMWSGEIIESYRDYMRL